MTETRRLAAILAADVAGYSRLMGADEAGTAQALREHRAATAPLIAKHGGRIVKTTGDGALIEFGSVVGAVQCAIALQKLMAERNARVTDDRRMDLRTGVHLGDVLVEGDDIIGDGVNIAARLEGIAEPGGICISEDAFRQVRGKVDAEFDDLGEQSLKNIARPLRVYRYRALSAAAAKLPGAALPLPDKPSLAVLPFQNLSGDPEQEYFADGMVEEIITALSRIKWLFVIARNSSFTYKGQTVDVKQVGRELGVRYVLEGSVRKAGGSVRITAQLIDAQSGAHLWADRFDGSLADVFDLQDKVAIAVAGVIEPTLQAAETVRSAARPTRDLTAYDLYLRAFAIFLTSRKQIPEVIHLLEEATERDPRYGPALALAALCHAQLCLDDRSEDPAADSQTGVDLARRALRVAGEHPGILVDAALALAALGEDIGAMIGLVNRALALNPSFARGWYVSGVFRNWAGQPDLAIEHAQNSLRLSPRVRVGTSLRVIAVAHFVGRRFGDAISTLLLAIQDDPSFADTYRWLAASYAHMGRLDQARETIERLKILTSVVVPTIIPLRNGEHRELFVSGLRLAAGEAE